MSATLHEPEALHSDYIAAACIVRFPKLPMDASRLPAVPFAQIFESEAQELIDLTGKDDAYPALIACVRC